MKGKDKHLRRLKTLTAEGQKVVNRVLYVGADMIRAEAFQSISRGAVSGKNHVPSAPGEPPNRDTGNLQSNIETSMPEPLVAQVTSSAAHATPLEFGTSKMAARPYMRPARDKEKPKIERLLVTEMDKLVKRSGR